jgi:hypothetical protein
MEAVTDGAGSGTAGGREGSGATGAATRGAVTTAAGGAPGRAGGTGAFAWACATMRAASDRPQPAATQSGRDALTVEAFAEALMRSIQPFDG